MSNQNSSGNDNENSKDPWQESWDAWNELNKSNMTDEELFRWQEVVLKEFQEIVNRESGQVEASRALRDAQLTSIVSAHKEIPVKAHREIVNSILDDMFSMGPLEALWKNKEISDMQIFVPYDARERQIITFSSVKGREVYNGPGFRNYGHAMTWLNRHLATYGQHYDASKVSMDATFPNGERMHIISGTSGYSTFKNGEYKYVPCVIITLRRFTHSFTTHELTSQSEALAVPPQFPTLREINRNYQRKTLYFKYDGKSLDHATMDYLRIMTKMAKTHLISGGTGSGKSSLANALTAEIPPGTIMEILEESPELQPQNDMHAIRIVQREGVFELHDAMKAALRQYPDRIFIAELRDTLAYTFLRAIQSGHSGSSTTIHANSCLDAIDVLVNFAANHTSNPPREMVREIIFRQVHAIIYANAIKKPGGISRMIGEVAQLIPHDHSLHYVMKFHQVGINEDGSVAGYFEFFGPTDEFIEEMFDAGIPIPESWGWTE